MNHRAASTVRIATQALRLRGWVVRPAHVWVIMAALLGGCDAVDAPIQAGLQWWFADEEGDQVSEGAGEAGAPKAHAASEHPPAAGAAKAQKPDSTAVVATPTIDLKAATIRGTEPPARRRLVDQIARLWQIASVGEVRALGPFLSRRTREQLDPAARGLVPIAPRTLWQRISGTITAIRFDGGRALVTVKRDGRETTLTYFIEEEQWRLDLLAEQPVAAATELPSQRAVMPTLREATAGLRGTGPLVAVVVTSVGTFRCELDEARISEPVAAFVALARGKIASLREAPDGTALWLEQPYFDGGTNESSVAGGYAALRGRSPRHGSGVRIPDALKLGFRFESAGLLALANDGPDSADGDFIVTLAAVPSFDDRLTRIGRCNDLDVVAAIADKPAGSVKLERLEIQRGF